MQKELTDFLNLPRRGTVLGVQNNTLYLKNFLAEHIHTFLYISLCAWVWVRQCVLFVYVSEFVCGGETW